MSTSQSIQGLIKWSQRGEWRDNFETALERHVGPACRSAGIGLDELAEIIGDHWMTTLWGCVFEDLVSAGRAERNVADDYLKRRGWKESAGTRAYIEALRRSSTSLYEVSDIVGGVSFLARDLVRSGEPVRVFERSATSKPVPVGPDCRTGRDGPWQDPDHRQRVALLPSARRRSGGVDRTSAEESARRGGEACAFAWAER